MKKILIAVAVVIVLIAGWLIFRGAAGEDDNALTAKVEKGDFAVFVNTTGELKAKNSEEIRGPQNARQFRIWNFKIQDIIPEGTFVKEGDHVATLDRSEITNYMKDIQIELSKAESQLLQAKLDSAIELREARTELQNLNYQLEEKQIEFEQSKYEPPAIIRRMEIEAQKAKDAHEEAQKNYKLKQQRSEAKVEEIRANLLQHEHQLEQLQDVIKDFTIMAPKNGMLQYRTLWNGEKVAAGSNVSAWDPVIATLPDLSSMVSTTYVSEVDISKVKKDQKVEVGIDAFPDLKLPGVVTAVANVGQQLPGGESKVFEVTVELEQTDSLLRPAMTTSNRIMVASRPEVLSVPLEALYTNDSLTYVYQRSGVRIVKQEVKVGLTNDTQAEILRGLQTDDVIYLSEPAGADDFTLKRLEEEEKTAEKED